MPFLLPKITFKDATREIFFDERLILLMYLFYNCNFPQNKLIIFYLPYSKLLGVLFKLGSDCNNVQPEID